MQNDEPVKAFHRSDRKAKEAKASYPGPIIIITKLLYLSLVICVVISLSLRWQNDHLPPLAEIDCSSP